MHVYTINGNSEKQDPKVNGTSNSPHQDQVIIPNETQYKPLSHWLWNRDTVKIFGYLSAIVPFIIMFNVSSLPTLPYPMGGNLLDWQQGVIPIVWRNGTVLVLLLWGIVYCCKTTLIIMTHNWCLCCTKSRPPRDRKEVSFQQTTSLGHLAVPLICCHVFFGAWIGWANNFHSGYHTSDTEYLISGCLIFVAGQITYFITSVVRLYHKDPSHLRVLCELADLVAFLGFALVSFTLSAFTWLLFKLVMSAFVLGQLLDTGLF